MINQYFWLIFSCASYRAIQTIVDTNEEDGSSTDGEPSDEDKASSDDSENEEQRRDELELSLVDLTPQFASLFSNE